MSNRFRLLLMLFLAVLTLVVALPLLTIPARIPVTGMVSINVKPEAAFRVMSDSTSWRRWWPGEIDEKTGVMHFDGLSFGKPVSYYRSFRIETKDNNRSRQTTLLMIPAGQDSTIVSWVDSIATPASPLARWRGRQDAGSRAVVMNKILGALRHYLANPVNVYGFRPVRETSRDSTLISILFQTADTPGTDIIYGKLAGLSAYINHRHAGIVNFPMMHIEGKPGLYLTMLAYPVNKELPDSGDYKFKRFLPWKVVSGEVRGGEQTIRSGYRQFYLYISDYGIPVMANGFYFLVTDRSREPDSSKWVTRFSVPIP